MIDPKYSREELASALESSVKLQSHYARLLNMHDSGTRVGFADAAAWLERMRELQRREDFGPNGDATTPGFFREEKSGER